MPPEEIVRVEAEKYTAKTIENIRETLGLSYGELSKRMADAGCPMDKSSLQKIEKGTPRRKISVNELVAFAEVFDVPVTYLVGAPKGNELELAWRDLINAESLANVLRVARQEYEGHTRELRRIARENEEFRSLVEKRYLQHRTQILDRAFKDAKSDGAETEEDFQNYLTRWDHDTPVTLTGRDVLGIPGILGVGDNGE